MTAPPEGSIFPSIMHSMHKWSIVWRILELLYYLSGVAIAIIAGFGLKQLSLAKSSLKQTSELAKLSAKREAYKLAGEQCQQYLNHIIPILNECDERLKDSGILDQLNAFEVSAKDNMISVRPPKDIKDNIFKSLKDTELLAIGKVANALEGFAILFTSGVASEAVAFSSVGVTFCYTVKQYAPVIVPLAEREHYQHVLQLFLLWQTRITKAQLIREQVKIADQLLKTQEHHINPIGT